MSKLTDATKYDPWSWCLIYTSWGIRCCFDWNEI